MYSIPPVSNKCSKMIRAKLKRKKMAEHATQTILDIFTLDNAGYLCFTKHFIRQYTWLPFGSWQKPKQNEATLPPTPPHPHSLQCNKTSGRARLIKRTYSESRRKSRGAPGSEPVPWAVLFSLPFLLS